jgi:hypothetical protein
VNNSASTAAKRLVEDIHREKLMRTPDGRVWTAVSAEQSMKFDDDIRSVQSIEQAQAVAERIFAASTQPEHVVGDGPNWHDRERALLTILVSRAARDCPTSQLPLDYMRKLVNTTKRNIAENLTEGEAAFLASCPQECISENVLAHINGRLLPFTPNALHSA